MANSAVKLVAGILIWFSVWILGFHFGEDIQNHRWLMIYGVFLAGCANFLVNIAEGFIDE